MLKIYKHSNQQHHGRCLVSLYMTYLKILIIQTFDFSVNNLIADILPFGEDDIHSGEDAYQDEHVSVPIKLCESKFGNSVGDFIADIKCF